MYDEAATTGSWRWSFCRCIMIGWDHLYDYYEYAVSNDKLVTRNLGSGNVPSNIRYAFPSQLCCYCISRRDCEPGSPMLILATV